MKEQIAGTLSVRNVHLARVPQQEPGVAPCIVFLIPLFVDGRFNG